VLGYFERSRWGSELMMGNPLLDNAPEGEIVT